MRLTHVQTTSDLHAQLKRKLVVMLLTYIFSGFNICFLDSRFSRDIYGHIYIYSVVHMSSFGLVVYTIHFPAALYTLEQSIKVSHQLSISLGKVALDHCNHHIPKKPTTMSLTFVIIPFSMTSKQGELLFNKLSFLSAHTLCTNLPVDSFYIILNMINKITL